MQRGAQSRNTIVKSTEYIYMKSYRKENYTKERAQECGIRTSEGSIVNFWGKPSKWIYFVKVANFEFAFFSIEMLDTYIDYYQRDILPTSRFYGISPFSDGSAASQGDGQSPFERLPARLRKKNVRPKVLKKLKEARQYFISNA